MKKSLSLLLAIVLVFSVFSSLAFAAETQQSAGQILSKAGIIKGDGSGDLKEDQPWTRQDVAVLISRLVGAEDVAKSTAKNHTYADVKGTFYDGYLTWAKDEGIMEGHSAIRFGFDENVTAQQFAAIVLRVLGVEVAYDDALEFAVENGLFPAELATGEFNRGTSFVVLVNTLNVEVEEGVTLGAYLGLPGFVAEVGDQAIASFKAVGAKTFEVKFVEAVDTDKAEVSLQRGTIAANISKVSYSDDKKTATIETAAKFLKGDYTVTVKNVTADDLKATTSVEAETVANIEFTSDKAPLVRKADGSIDYTKIYTWVKVTNQYGEDITATTSGLTFTAGKGTVTPKLNDGIIQLDSQHDFMLNEKVPVSVVHTASTKFASEVVTVSAPAQVASINIVKLVKDGDATLNVTAATDKFWLEIEAKDQYGNKVPANQVGQDILVSVANPNVLNVNQNANKEPIFENKDNTTILKLAKASNVQGNDNFGRGKTSIHFFSRTTPSQASIEIEVVDTAKVDELTITAPEIAVIGEKTEVPFVATDQFGNEMNNAEDIANGLSSKIQVSGLADADLYFEQDFVNGKAKLILDLTKVPNKDNITTSIPLFINAYTSSFKMVQLNVSAQPVKKPQVISAVEGTTRAVALEGTTNFDLSKIKVIDQYGRTLNASDFEGYVVNIESSDANKLSFNNSTETKTANLAKGATEKVDVYAKNAGTSSFTLKLYKGTVADANLVSGSDNSFSIRAVKADEITDYEIDELPVIYYGGAKYAKKLNVNGLLGDGTKVSIPYKDTYFTVTNNVYDQGLSYNENTGEVSVGGVAFSDPGKERTFTLIFQAEAKNTAVVKTIEVKASSVKPVSTKFEVRTKGDATKVADGVIKISQNKARALTNTNVYALANDAIKVTDQYGVEIDSASKFSSVKFSNVPDGDITKINKGQSFNISVVTADANASHSVIKVQVDQ